MRKQQGLSLVELMISITLGLVLMTGVMQMFLSSRTVFTTHQAISRIQESGRLAMEFMSRDIRMAGFMGCVSRNMESINDPYVGFSNILNSSSDALYDFERGIEGATAGAGGQPPARFSDLPNNLVPNSDILVVRSASGSAASVMQPSASGSVVVAYTGATSGVCPGGGTRISGICTNDVLAIADCSKARVFQVTGVTADVSAGRVSLALNGSATPGNANTNWELGLFDTDAEVIQAVRTVYFVAENAAGRPSLWQKDGSEAAQELLEGVADMRLSYGLDTDNDAIPDEYVAASGVSANQWGNVLSVRVQLLIESLDDNVLEEPQPYTFNDETVTPTDRRMRQVFVNTIGIRSSLL